VNDRQAIERIRRIVESTASNLRDINRALGRTEPKLEDLEVAVKTGVLDARLEREGNEAIVAAVELLCEELVALRMREVLPRA
jgi:hypothetical protein